MEYNPVRLIIGIISFLFALLGVFFLGLALVVFSFCSIRRRSLCLR